MNNQELTESGILYIVGTPIGNLEDITFRALKILQNVNLIAAEDTRHTGKLLHHFQIKTPQISYHEHNSKLRGQELLNRLQNGDNIALVTDAGMPGISDPGYEIINLCINEGITVIPVPGPTAAITALVASGLPTDKFIFEGFLPPKSTPRIEHLLCLKNESRTILFYESPHRILATLSDLRTVFGEHRKITIARELTKLHEEFWRGNLQDAVSLYQNKTKILGEFTLIVAGNNEQNIPIFSDEQIKQELQQLLAQGLSKSQASRNLASLINQSKNYIYQIALTIDV
jgi:16S rRNA (cytidine1402-2'-O)-methyltransferase